MKIKMKKNKIEKIPAEGRRRDYCLILSNPKNRKNIGPIEVLGYFAITAFRPKTSLPEKCLLWRLKYGQNLLPTSRKAVFAPN